jgi:serine protease
MVALSRCLSSLAVFVGTAVGARVAKKRGEKTDVKFIAGVPVLNYHAAYAGESLGSLGAEEEWVVVVNPGVSDKQIQDMCHKSKNGCKLAGNPSKGGVPFFEMRGSESDLEAVIENGKGAVKYVEPDTLVFAIPELKASDTEAQLWGLERVGAYRRSSEGAGVTVFLTDTGVRVSHADFGGRAIPTLDMTSDSLVECNGDASCAGDKQGHGTHCAGTTAGASYGVAPAATIRSVKVLSDAGSGSWSWSYGALNWMATSDIRPAIASMSLGGRGTQSAMRDAVDAASNAGVTVIVAGGNSNSDACGFSPAFVESAITVGSTDSRDRRSSFSNYGKCTNIWAPGSDIKSAGHRSDTATATFSGTSMACPHVAGGAALVLQKNPGFNYAKVLQSLQDDADTDRITGLMTGDLNKLLFVGEGGAPPAPPADECPWYCVVCVLSQCQGCC